MDAPAGEFEEEEHVEASEPERLDGEKVAGDDRVGVGPQELAPAELGASAGPERRRLAAGSWRPLLPRRASRSTNSRISSETAGLPGRRPAYVHRFRTSWRCQLQQRVRTDEERAARSAQ